MDITNCICNVAILNHRKIKWQNFNSKIFFFFEQKKTIYYALKMSRTNKISLCRLECSENIM